MTSHQLMLKRFIESHELEAILQDDGIVVYLPRVTAAGLEAVEAVYCETTRAARAALGY